MDNVIKILVSICIDLNSQMQTAQSTIGAMSELIEDMLRCWEEVKELSAGNRRLRKLVEDLKKQVAHWEIYNKHLTGFNRPQGPQRDAVKELMDLKVIKEGLENQISNLKHLLKDRSEKYEDAFAWKEKRKMENEALKKQLEVIKELREKEGSKYERDLAEEKKKLKMEKATKKKMKEENTDLKNQNDDNVRKLEGYMEN